MPQTGTQTCTNQHNKHRFIALSESSKRMHKAAARRLALQAAAAAAGQRRSSRTAISIG